MDFTEERSSAEVSTFLDFRGKRCQERILAGLFFQTFSGQAEVYDSLSDTRASKTVLGNRYLEKNLKHLLWTESFCLFRSFKCIYTLLSAEKKLCQSVTCI